MVKSTGCSTQALHVHDHVRTSEVDLERVLSTAGSMAWLIHWSVQHCPGLRSAARPLSMVSRLQDQRYLCEAVSIPREVMPQPPLDDGSVGMCPRLALCSNLFSLNHEHAMLRSYHPEQPRSRPITEGKLDWARSVLRWVTTREYLVL